MVCSPHAPHNKGASSPTKLRAGVEGAAAIGDCAVLRAPRHTATTLRTNRGLTSKTVLRTTGRCAPMALNYAKRPCPICETRNAGAHTTPPPNHCSSWFQTPAVTASTVDVYGQGSRMEGGCRREACPNPLGARRAVLSWCIGSPKARTNSRRRAIIEPNSLYSKTMPLAGKRLPTSCSRRWVYLSLWTTSARPGGRALADWEVGRRQKHSRGHGSAVMRFFWPQPKRIAPPSLHDRSGR